MRITTAMIFKSAVTTLQKQSAQLMVAQQQAASGKVVQRPSDDAVGTRRILDLRQALASIEQFQRNHNTINSLLSNTETGLQDVENLMLRARTLTLSAINDTANPENRQAIAVEVSDLFEQALQIGNTFVHGRYLFAGQAGSAAPFTATATATSRANGLAASGTLVPLADGELSINGTPIRAAQVADDTVSTSDPAASALAIAAAINDAFATTGVQAQASTTLSLSVLDFGDLAGNNLLINGQAITGTISDAASLVAAINAANVPGVVASSSGSGNLTLSAADGRNVQLQTDGLTASNMTFANFDLGGGSALDQTATGTVTLSSAAAFTLGGLHLTPAGFSAGPVNLTAQYVGDPREVLMAMNTGQTLPVNIPGSQFLASDLYPDIDRDTPLASLRLGQGISAGSIQITDRVSNTATIDLSTTLTIGDVIDTISAAAGVNVTAAISSTGDGLMITDDNAVPTRNLTLTEAGAGTTASELGLTLDRPGALVGAPLTPALTPATPVSLLYGGQGVSLSSLHIANGTTEVDVDLSSAGTIGDVLAAINSSGTNVTARINAAGTALEVRSNDPTTVAIVTEVGDGTTAADLGVQGARDTLQTLSLLQEALQKNDPNALAHLLTSIDENLQQLVTLRTDIGARTNRVDLVTSNLEDLKLHTRTLLSDTEDGDAFELLTRLTQFNTAFEIALATTARIVQPTLLDFLR